MDFQLINSPETKSGHPDPAMAIPPPPDVEPFVNFDPMNADYEITYFRNATAESNVEDLEKILLEETLPDVLFQQQDSTNPQTSLEQMPRITKVAVHSSVRIPSSDKGKLYEHSNGALNILVYSGPEGKCEGYPNSPKHYHYLCKLLKMKNFKRPIRKSTEVGIPAAVPATPEVQGQPSSTSDQIDNGEREAEGQSDNIYDIGRELADGNANDAAATKAQQRNCVFELQSFQPSQVSILESQPQQQIVESQPQQQIVESQPQQQIVESQPQQHVTENAIQQQQPLISQPLITPSVKPPPNSSSSYEDVMGSCMQQVRIRQKSVITHTNHVIQPKKPNSCNRTYLESPRASSNIQLQPRGEYLPSLQDTGMINPVAHQPFVGVTAFQLPAKLQVNQNSPGNMSQAQPTTRPGFPQMGMCAGGTLQQTHIPFQHLSAPPHPHQTYAYGAPGFSDVQHAPPQLTTPTPHQMYPAPGHSQHLFMNNQPYMIDPQTPYAYQPPPPNFPPIALQSQISDPRMMFPQHQLPPFASQNQAGMRTTATKKKRPLAKGPIPVVEINDSDDESGSSAKALGASAEPKNGIVIPLQKANRSKGKGKGGRKEDDINMTKLRAQLLARGTNSASIPTPTLPISIVAQNCENGDAPPVPKPKRKYVRKPKPKPVIDGQQVEQNGTSEAGIQSVDNLSPVKSKRKFTKKNKDAVGGQQIGENRLDWISQQLPEIESAMATATCNALSGNAIPPIIKPKRKPNTKKKKDPSDNLQVQNGSSTTMPASDVGSAKPLGESPVKKRKSYYKPRPKKEKADALQPIKTSPNSSKNVKMDKHEEWLLGQRKLEEIKMQMYNMEKPMVFSNTGNVLIRPPEKIKSGVVKVENAKVVATTGISEAGDRPGVGYSVEGGVQYPEGTPAFTTVNCGQGSRGDVRTASEQTSDLVNSIAQAFGMSGVAGPPNKASDSPIDAIFNDALSVVENDGKNGRMEGERIDDGEKRVKKKAKRRNNSDDKKSDVEKGQGGKGKKRQRMSQSGAESLEDLAQKSKRSRRSTLSSENDEGASGERRTTRSRSGALLKRPIVDPSSSEDEKSDDSEASESMTEEEGSDNIEDGARQVEKARGKPSKRRQTHVQRLAKNAKGIMRKRKIANGQIKVEAGRKFASKVEYDDSTDDDADIEDLDDEDVADNKPKNKVKRSGKKECSFGLKCGSSTQYKPHYTDEERGRLYADKCFVMDLKDVDKDVGNYCIWEIYDEGRYLRQYWPSKFGERQFFNSTPTKWYFLEEDWKQEEFYNRFQPIVVVICPDTVERILEAKETDTTSALPEVVEQIVQFVYIDRLFFPRMAKNLGRIHFTDYLQIPFIKSFPVYSFLALNPEFLSLHFSGRLHSKFLSFLNHWFVLENSLKGICLDIQKGCDLSIDALDQLKRFPDMTYSLNNVKKDVNCSACRTLERTPAVKVKFSRRRSGRKQYNWDTLEEIEEEQVVKPPADTYWCRPCSVAARKFHRFYHFRYVLLRIVTQNMEKTAEIFTSRNADVTDTMLIWAMDTEKSFHNCMFLDFQVCAAEVHAEFFPNPQVLQPPPVDVGPQVTSDNLETENVRVVPAEPHGVEEMEVVAPVEPKREEVMEVEAPVEPQREVEIEEVAQVLPS